MPLFGHCFVSDALKRPVFDPTGEVVGKLTDAVVVRGDQLPRIAAILVSREGRLVRIPWADVEIFNKRILSTRLAAAAVEPYQADERDLLVARDILDKQIVDANGAKVVRVNDVRLEGYNGDAVLTAVDVGLRGLLRRLGVERRSDQVFSLLKVDLPANLIGWQYIQPLSPKLNAIGLTVPRQMVADLHPADLAEILSQVSREEGQNLFTELDVKTAADALSELRPERQVELITAVEPEKAADILEEMPPDEASDVLADLPTEKASEILGHIEGEEAKDIQELLSYEGDTAGGLMTNAYIAYSPGTTVARAIERFRADADSIEPVYQIYVVDREEKLVGMVTLRELLLAEPGAPLGALIKRKPQSVGPDEDAKGIAAVMSKYDLVAVPVVDAEGRLLGVVTVDDILDGLLPSPVKRMRRGA
jgi:CBS domain-containing protein